jgi:hypothetical protein
MPSSHSIRCLAPGCPHPGNHRGLCAACYRSASERIRRGQTTWAALVAAGQAHPAKPSPWRGGRPRAE